MNDLVSSDKFDQTAQSFTQSSILLKHQSVSCSCSQWRDRKLSDFITDIPKMKESLTGLERH